MSKIYLCDRGCVIKRCDFKKMFNGAAYMNMIGTMTLRYSGKIGGVKIARCYKATFAELVLPRTFISFLIKKDFVKKENIIFNMSMGQKLSKDYKMDGLFPNQLLICKWLIENIYTESRRIIGLAGCVLNLQAGLGKTFVAGGLISMIGRRALYIVPRKHLQKQAEEDLDFDAGDVQFIVINSALKKPPEFFKEFGLIIFDEIHMYCSAVFREIFFKAQAANVLGLTATPKRMDGFEKIYKLAVGKIINAEELPNYEKSADVFKGRVRAVFYSGPPKYTTPLISPATGRPNAQDMIKKLSMDPQRNELIIKLAKELWADGYCIYIFVENRAHVEIIKKILGNDCGEVAALMGGSNPEDEQYKKCRIIVLTYSYGGTGLSYVRMNAAIFATPRRSNYEQICRRITRKGSDETVERVYIDIIDKNTFLQHQFKSRKEVYKYFNYKISYS